MAKKPTSTGTKKPTTTRGAAAPAPAAAPKARAAKPAATTEVRNTAVPPKAAAASRRELTHDMIARRAYEIFASGRGGSEMDNWCRAERELRSELGL